MMTGDQVNAEITKVDIAQTIKQQKLDQEQHYDLDGVTKVEGQVIVPTASKIPKHFLRNKVKMIYNKFFEGKWVR